MSRNYRKERVQLYFSSCATIIRFSKFSIAHDLVQALGNDTAEKLVRMLHFLSHLSVQGYDSSSANISWRGFFRQTNRVFPPGGLLTDKIRWQEALMRSQVRRTSQPCYGCWTSVTKFTPVTTILYFLEWDMWRMRFESNFPENDNLDFFGLGVSLRNENKLRES